ncbi:MAG: hypothetical protein ACKVX7_19475 [Planctomycetota bacterium]
MKMRVAASAGELGAAQARYVIKRLAAAAPELEVEARSTSDALNEVEFIVESLEPSALAAASTAAASTADSDLIAVMPREWPWDVFLSREYPGLVDVPANELVVVSSARRLAQLRYHFPHLRAEQRSAVVVADNDQFDTTGCAGRIMSAAEIHWRELAGLVRSTLSPTEMTPAPAQGTLGVRARTDDRALVNRVRESLDHAPTRAAVTAEISFLAEFGGDARLPIGACARAVGSQLVLLGVLASADGRQLVQLATEGDVGNPERIAADLAHKMRRAGGAEIIASFSA